MGARAFRSGRLLAVLLLSVMISVRMDVLFSYYLNDQTSAIQVALGGRDAGNDAVQASGEQRLLRPPSSCSLCCSPPTSPESCWTCI